MLIAYYFMWQTRHPAPGQWGRLLYIAGPQGISYGLEDGEEDIFPDSIAFSNILEYDARLRRCRYSTPRDGAPSQIKCL
jgi:hypothetical protein